MHSEVIEGEARHYAKIEINCNFHNSSLDFESWKKKKIEILIFFLFISRAVKTKIYSLIRENYFTKRFSGEWKITKKKNWNSEKYFWGFAAVGACRWINDSSAQNTFNWLCCNIIIAGNQLNTIFLVIFFFFSTLFAQRNNILINK